MMCRIEEDGSGVGFAVIAVGDDEQDLREYKNGLKGTSLNDWMRKNPDLVWTAHQIEDHRGGSCVDDD